MSKKIRYVAFILLAIALMIMNGSFNVKAKEDQGANRMNVVFVLDQSGSMYKTDKNSLRYDAVDLFLGLSMDSGNYIGAVIFDDGIVKQMDLKEMSGSNAKNQFSDEIRAAYSNGDTDIGKAIDLATDMLEQSGKIDLPSAVILLSDGNTDLSKDKTGEATTLSEQLKQKAIDRARNNGYQIYSICLNSNGAANPEELHEISAATGGTCVEVKTAEDLKEVFRQFYSIIFSTETVVLADTVLPDSGELEIPFTIPEVGVEEANIIISTLNANATYSLYKPRNIALTEDELDAMKISAKTFSVVKIRHPEPGQWKLIIKGTSNDHVKIEMIYNSDLTIQLERLTGEEEGYIGARSIVAKIYNRGAEITDEYFFVNNPVYVIIKDLQKGTEQQFRMQAEANRSYYEWEYDKHGDYELYAYSVVDGMTVESDILKYSVVNKAPECEKLIKICEMWSPFSEEYLMVDLSNYFSDLEDYRLTYIIKNSDYDEQCVYMDNAELYVKLKECIGRGELYVTAIDSDGAEVEAKVDLKVTSIFKILLWILLPILLVVGIILFLKWNKNNSRMIRGRILISAYDEDGFIGSPNTIEGGKGKLYLSRYFTVKRDVGIMLGQTYFCAGEKENYIYLLSKTGLYKNHLDTRENKIRLNTEMEVNVSSDVDFNKGIRVTYISDDMKY